MGQLIKGVQIEVRAIGLDLADQWSDWAAIDENGQIVRRGRVKTTQGALSELFSSFKSTLIALEVGTHSAWVSRLLKSVGHQAVVANARKIALIHQNRRKNNRIDAELLARLARADERLLFAIHHRDEGSQLELALLRTRDIFVRSRTKLINHVRGSCKMFGVQLRSCSSSAFCARSRATLPEALRLVLEPVLDQIGGLSEQIKQFDQRIEAMAERHQEARQLRQIKGVGALTAMAFVLTIEDPHRIRRSRSAGAYFGLAPGSDDSGEKHQPRRITKEGDAFCRRLLVNAAHYILGPFGADCDLRRHGEAIAQRGGKNAKKRAVIAVARKLAVLMHRLWITGQSYVPLHRCSTVVAA